MYLGTSQNIDAFRLLILLLDDFISLVGDRHHTTTVISLIPTMLITLSVWKYWNCKCYYTDEAWLRLRSWRNMLYMYVFSDGICFPMITIYEIICCNLMNLIVFFQYVYVFLPIGRLCPSYFINEKFWKFAFLLYRI